MKTQTTVLALAATTLVILSGCKATNSPSAASTTVAASVDADSDSASGTGDNPTSEATTGPTETAAPEPGKTTTSAKVKKTTKPTPTKTKTTDSGPTIVSFKLVQKPKCPEGTAVFRAPAVPAIIKWTITGADSAALSVDDPTNTPGTYGPEPLTGTEEFTFSCATEVGSTEKHTYAIWALGADGKKRSKTITATAKILDTGKS
ncbi:hypothetical protein BJ973_001034 [Actinoplanes tereljensis]|uniref:Ig-like domain-containing protein n=1 Tax=Paractinoplanes tereljensis TaxID=571912 RepID=A0A919NWN4_9ACTN|nr:hypothetical protein [Actinoplanes tereljensis]GIF26590.1 hypothetical protein Ate02nite_93200 [Actinoplanes tereljensis]